jgi:hypothetical protein
MRRLPLLLILPFTLALGGCPGGDDADTATPPAGDVGNYAPYAAGNRWLYESAGESTPDSTTGALTDASLVTLPGGVDALELRTLSLSSLLYVDLSYLEKRPDALYEVYPSFRRPVPGVTALPQLRFPLRAGDRYTAYRYDNLNSGVDDDDDDINETFSRRLDIEVAGVESVTVPAGTFPEALKVISTYTSTTHYSTGSSGSSVEEVTRWYAPDVGVVQSRTATSSYGLPGTVNVMRLVSHRLDGVRSESVAPTVQSVSPAPDSSVNSGFGVGASVTFSEEMDPASFNDAVLTIYDADGNARSGSVVYGDRRLRFATGYMLPVGNYTVTLGTGPTDVLGNPLAAPYTWHFTRTESSSGCTGSAQFC